MSTRRVYEIHIEGYLGDDWKDWFEGLVIRHEVSKEHELVQTILFGSIDQSQLHGVLAKIRDLNIAVLSVNQISSI